MSSLKAGVAYFAIVFAAGFFVGAVRVLFVVPAAREIAAVSIELPIMLAISWIACAHVIRHFSVPSRVPERALMSATAFLLLMLAELLLSVAVFGRSGIEFAVSLVRLPGAIGLAGQTAFATFPLLRLRQK